MLLEVNMSYNVVLEYRAATGGFEGVRTWTSFLSKKEFEQWLDDSVLEKQKVLAEGVTREKAIEICDKTPIECRYAAAAQEVENIFKALG